MSHPQLLRRLAFVLLACFSATVTSAEGRSLQGDIDLGESFTLRVLIRAEGTSPADLPALVTNKDWEAGAVEDYTTNNAYGLGRASGAAAGFAISVLPDGAWTWNAGDGSRRIDHRPEAADQSIIDGRWHEVGFAVDRAMGVAHLYHDGRRVALHELSVGSLASESGEIRLTEPEGFELKDLRVEPGALGRARVADEFASRLGEDRRPAPLPAWDGRPLKVLAWNIWHGGRRKGVDEGVQRVVEVIQESGADIVLMQETYGSGPCISGRLGFDYCLRSSNLSIHSRFPITDVHRLYQGFRFGGATIELGPGTEIQAYSLWIHYLPSVQDQLAKDASVESMLEEEGKTRGREIEEILGELVPHLDAAPVVPVLVGGDFNSGSHLDWTDAGLAIPSHHGRVIPWPVSRSMAREGFVDTFRARHPDPVASPGFTWSPEFPDSHPERIDYVYASRGDWRVLESRVLDTHPRGWPSDHAAVLSTLELVAPPPALRVMSYNIHYGVGMDDVTDLARIAAIIRDADCDLVGLQEIGNRAMAEELGRLTGMPAVFGPSKGSDKGYGDAVLCKHPMTWVGNLSLPSASSSRYQAMAVDVDLSALYGDGSSVRFINTHYDWTDSVGSQEARRVSARVIERGLCEGMPGHALLAGDLNASPGSPPLEDLAARGWHVPGVGQPMATHGAPDPTQQIDYVLVRPRQGWRVTDVRVLDEPVASDHYPVVLTARPVR